MDLVILTVPLLAFFLSIIVRKRKAKLVLNLLQILLAINAILFFLHLQQISGGPDIGKAVGQCVIPCVFFFCMMLHGLLAFVWNIHNKKS